MSGEALVSQAQLIEVYSIIQNNKLTHQFVIHLAVHRFIVPTIAVTRLGEEEGIRAPGLLVANEEKSEIRHGATIT